jgi:hypothetical protein
MEDRPVDGFLEDLILKGAVEVSAYDPDSNEFLYSLTEKAAEISPDLVRRADQIFHMEIMALWEAGFINMNPSSANPVVSLSERALDNDALETLPRELRNTLALITEALKI